MEAEACEGDDSEPTLALVLRSVRVQDLPLCFPGRDCFDVPPGGARVLHLVSDVTPASPGIAAVLWAGLGAVILVIVSGLRQQRRGAAVRPWPALLALGLIVSGTVLAWAAHAWLGEAALVYGGADGRPAEPTPSSVIAACPLVQSAAWVGIAVGVVTLLLTLNTVAVRRRRAGRAQTDRLG